MDSRHRGTAVTHGGGRRVLLSCQRNWTRVTVSRKNPPLPTCSVAQNHPTVMRAGTVIPPKIPSSSSSESQFSRMLAPGLAVGLSTGQADCPADGRLRRRARRTLLGRPPRGRCPTAAAPRAAAALGDSGLPGANWSSQRPTTASGRQQRRAPGTDWRSVSPCRTGRLPAAGPWPAGSLTLVPGVIRGVLSVAPARRPAPPALPAGPCRALAGLETPPPSPLTLAPPADTARCRCCDCLGQLANGDSPTRKILLVYFSSVG